MEEGLAGVVLVKAEKLLPLLYLLFVGRFLTS